MYRISSNIILFRVTEIFVAAFYLFRCSRSKGIKRKKKLNIDILERIHIRVPTKNLINQCDTELTFSHSLNTKYRRDAVVQLIMHPTGCIRSQDGRSTPRRSVALTRESSIRHGHTSPSRVSPRFFFFFFFVPRVPSARMCEMRAAACYAARYFNLVRDSGYSFSIPARLTYFKRYGGVVAR